MFEHVFACGDILCRTRRGFVGYQHADEAKTYDQALQRAPASTNAFAIGSKGIGETARWFSTNVTPAAPQAARSASWRSCIDRRLPSTLLARPVLRTPRP